MTFAAMTAIKQYCEGSISPSELTTQLNQVTEQALYATLDNNTLLSWVIELETDTVKCCIVIDALLRRALQQPAVFVYLLTTPNQNGKNPFYQALSYFRPNGHAIAKKLSEWLTFGVSLRFMSRSNYVKIHLTNARVLSNIAVSKKTDHFHVALREIHTGILNADEIDSIFQEKNAIVYHMALGSGSPEIIALMIQHAGAKVFSPNASYHTVLHYLAHKGKHKELTICFEEINKAITNGYLPPSVYFTTFRSGSTVQQTSLLSVGFHPAHGEISQILLANIEIAYRNNWINTQQYQEILFQHPQQNEGFSYLHEAIRSGHYRNVFVYMKLCLRAVITNELAFSDFRTLLLQRNKAGYPVFNQAINNEHLETAELFFNVFHHLLPQDYRKALFFRVHTHLPMCAIEKKDHIEINRLLQQETSRVENQVSLPPGTIIHYTDSKRLHLLPEFFELMRMIQDIYRQQQANQTLDHISKGIYSNPQCAGYTPQYFSSTSQHTQKPQAVHQQTFVDSNPHNHWS